MVVDVTGDHQVIAEVSFTAALTTLYEKAIYLHDARQYQVERFDYEGRKAYVRRVDSDYFTDAIDYTQVKELEEVESSPAGGVKIAHGDVRLNRQIVGFKKIKFYTMENVGAGNLSMPEQEMHTTAFWLHFPADFPGALRRSLAHRSPGRTSRPGGAAANRRSSMCHVRSARPGRVDYGSSYRRCRHRRQPHRLRAESVPLRQLSRAASGRARRSTSWLPGSWTVRRSCWRPARARRAARAASAPSARSASGAKRSRGGFLKNFHSS